MHKAMSTETPASQQSQPADSSERLTKRDIVAEIDAELAHIANPATGYMNAVINRKLVVAARDELVALRAAIRVLEFADRMEGQFRYLADFYGVTDQIWSADAYRDERAALTQGSATAAPLPSQAESAGSNEPNPVGEKR